MPISTGLVVALAVVLVVVGVGAGFYAGVTMSGSGQTETLTVTTTFFTSTTFSQLPTTSASTQTITTELTGCDQAHPLSLTGVTWASSSQTGIVITSTWSNCASQSISFGVWMTNQVPLHIASTAYGQTTLCTGYIGNYFNEGTTEAGPSGTTSLQQPFYPYCSISPNATIDWIAGNLTAYDPATEQLISVSGSFNATK